VTSDHLGGGTTSPRAAVIRELLDEWHLIGVVPYEAVDEDDCLIAPIDERLSRGAGAAELHAFLADELSAGRFGEAAGANRSYDAAR
jgi:hypothetical protein